METPAAAQALPSGVLHFPEGIPGFENLTHLTLLQDEELLPIVFLWSLLEPKVCFPVLPVQRIRPDYQLRLSPEDRRVLDFAAEPVPGSNLFCLAILDLGDGTRPVTANLFAPIVVNLEKWIGKQVIQFDSTYSAVAEV